MNLFRINVEEAFKSAVYCSGTTGSGKSDIGMYTVQAIKQEHPDATIVVFDPTQDWMDRSGIPFASQPTSSYLPYRDFEKMPSLIFDLSMLGIPEQQSLVETFCKELMEWQASIPKHKRRQWFIVFEEAHTYFPEGCMRSKRYKNTVRMMTQGRNFRIRFMCITQFASLLDKNAMRYMRQRYFGYTDEPNDIRYVSKFFNDDADIENKVRGLEAGSFLYKNGDSYRQVEIQPFRSESHPILMRIPQPTVQSEPLQPSPNYTAAAKFIVVTVLGLLILWLTLGAK